MLRSRPRRYRVAMATAHDAAWSARAREAFASAGHRSGAARGAVIDLLARQDCCLGAQEIHDDLRANGRPVALATIYRCLDQLLELGLVQRVELGDGGARFEPAHDQHAGHHHHIVCERCGEVAMFEDEGLEDALHELSQRLPYAVSAHDVTLRGACPDCR